MMVYILETDYPSVEEHRMVLAIRSSMSELIDSEDFFLVLPLGTSSSLRSPIQLLMESDN